MGSDYWCERHFGWLTVSRQSNNGRSRPDALLLFLLYPPLLFGTLLMFWVGFEWGFIPVFLSAFLIAHFSKMSVLWALLFGAAFILGLAIFALCYYSLSASPRPNNLKRIAFFTSVAFVAAIASSLGSFVWSLYHDLSAAQTITIWKGWWTGTFLQSIILVGPLLYLFTPAIERTKAQFFEIPEPHVNLKWIYTAIISVSVVLTIFITGANVLGLMGIQQELATLPTQIEENFFKVTGSFQIITWISIGLVLATGLGGIYLVGTWNHNLSEKVEEKTQQLKEKEASLREALNQRDRLLKQVNHRVKDNLTMVLALLELQLKTGERRSVERMIKDSHARLRSLALVYETMYQTEAIDFVSLKQYCLKLSNRLSQSYRVNGCTIDVQINSDDIDLEIGRAVPLALILNELLVNAYTHGFEGYNSGTIFVEIKKNETQILLAVRDNGVGLPEGFDPSKQNTLGMKLILTLTRQLQGEFKIDESHKTGFNLQLPAESPEVKLKQTSKRKAC
ncbi:MAG: histidine kinase dimerization/phosphoacceptor domain -containing protein [Balneolaceae bacterium]|nr:histidine kinase dimerization/phosphoacceptor domain -containing protein [Balneolaceae bacterium]